MGRSLANDFMPLRHPLFHRTIQALFWDSKEAGFVHPTLENIDRFREELLRELEEGIKPIIEERCYRDPTVEKSEEESQIHQC